MYHTYRCEAFVVSSYENGEANRVFVVFTKDLGLVKTHARSVREERSKLRYHLLSGFRTEVTLVRGSEFWRLVNARDGRACSRENEGSFVKILNLVQRFLGEEETSPETWEDLTRVADALCGGDRDKVALLELIFLYRLLRREGYVDTGMLPDIDIRMRLDDLPNLSAEDREKTLQLIHDSVRDTQL